jgi:hypothetical protein
MRLGDMVKVSFQGKKPVTVKVAGFKDNGNIILVSFMFNSTRVIEVKKDRIII